MDMPKEVIRVRFSQNQIGLFIEFVDKEGHWCGLEQFKLDQPCSAEQFITQWLKSKRERGFTLEVESVDI